MDQETLDTVSAAEEAIGHLVEVSRKRGPLYHQNPKAVAQVSRTAKWLLSALAALRCELNVPYGDSQQQGN